MMKGRPILAVILALTLALVLACSPIAPSATGISKSDIEAINAARAARSAAIANRDAAASAAVATEDGVILPPNLPPRQGQSALREWFANFPATSVSFTSIAIDGAAGIAYDRGTYEATSKEGTVTPGKYLWIWRQQSDGSWRVAIAMWNLNAPAP
jgi:ketosteroid isomerase-like protein